MQAVNEVNKMKFICIIPARGGSKGIINKNIIDIEGHPLIYYTINAAIKSNIFDRVVVTTDSIKIGDISKKCGAEVPFIRPEYLATDDSRVDDSMVHALKYIEEYDKRYEYVCLIQPTSPLIDFEDIINVKKLLLEKEADMIVSVGESPINIRWARSLPEDLSMKNFSSGICGTNRQCFKNIYYLNGAIYLGKWNIFYEKKDYYQQNTFAYIMPYKKSIDIDNEFDLKLVRYLMKEKNNEIL